jgi:hypothetical protein
MKVVMFANQGDNVKLEEKVNKWMNDNTRVKIFHVKQSYAYNSKDDMFYTLISIWYTGGVS